jgi:hypothetical protein
MGNVGGNATKQSLTIMRMHLMVVVDCRRSTSTKRLRLPPSRPMVNLSATRFSLCDNWYCVAHQREREREKKKEVSIE